jgi:hypothetical protein
MQIYHGTSTKNLQSIKSEGINGPSYWGPIEKAREHQQSFGKEGVLLCVELADHDFKANVQLSQALYDNCDTDVIINENDVLASLDELESVVCHETISDYIIIT